MAESAKLRIPYIAAAQAQKHVTHNEAMTLLDTLVQLSVLDKDLTAPPAEPEEGDTYIVAGAGGSATGAWEGWEKRVARYLDGTWRSYLPGQGGGAGWSAWVIDEATVYVFDGEGWGAYAVPGGGGVSDGDKGDVVISSSGTVYRLDDDRAVLTVRAATTADITIATALNNGDSLDGVSLATGDLVLVKDQSTASQNGIYVVAAEPGRDPRFAAFNAHPGLLVTVREGTANADTLWLCTSNRGGTINSTGLAFDAFTGGGGGGAEDFTDLGDVPSSYTDHGGKAVAVKDDETGLEFVEFGSEFEGDLDDIDEGTTNKHFTATEKTKLSGIEAAADVTDATNVAAAGAVMDGDFSSNGLMTRTGAGAYASRTLTGTAEQIEVTNGSGAAGNPTVAAHIASQAEAEAGSDNVSLMTALRTAQAIAEQVPAASTSVAGRVELAVASEYRTGTDTGRALGVAEVWGAADYVTLTSSGNSTPVDFAAGINFALVLGENSTLANPTNDSKRQMGVIKVTATGSTRTLDLHSDYTPEANVEAFPISVETAETVYLVYLVDAANTIRIINVLRF